MVHSIASVTILFTYNHLEVVEYNVTGAGYHRNYSDIEGIDGRFHNYAKEELKK